MAAAFSVVAVTLSVTHFASLSNCAEVSDELPVWDVKGLDSLVCTSALLGLSPPPPHAVRLKGMASSAATAAARVGTDVDRSPRVRVRWVVSW